MNIFKVCVLPILFLSSQQLLAATYTGTILEIEVQEDITPPSIGITLGNTLQSDAGCSHLWVFVPLDDVSGSTLNNRKIALIMTAYAMKSTVTISLKECINQGTLPKIHYISSK